MDVLDGMDEIALEALFSNLVRCLRRLRHPPRPPDAGLLKAISRRDVSRQYLYAGCLFRLLNCKTVLSITPQNSARPSPRQGHVSL